VLRKGGIIITIAGAALPPDKAREAGIRSTNMLVKRSGAQLRELGALIDAGALKLVVSQQLPLSQAAKAHELIETRHTRGKIVLTVEDEGESRPRPLDGP
jgi:NADPH:quinone reductase-like Zn-dependent oxidoreductase